MDRAFLDKIFDRVEDVLRDQCRRIRISRSENLLVTAPEYSLLSEQVRKEFFKLPGYPQTQLNLEVLKRRSKP